MKPSKVEIIGDKEWPARADVYIDGRQVHGVKAIRFTHEAMKLPELEIDISGAEMEMNGLDVGITECCNLTIKRA